MRNSVVFLVLLLGGCSLYLELDDPLEASQSDMAQEDLDMSNNTDMFEDLPETPDVSGDMPEEEMDVSDSDPLECPAGLWLYEGVVCQHWTDCRAGQYVLEEPTATSDRLCGECDADSTSTGINALSCGDVCSEVFGRSCDELQTAYLKSRDPGAEDEFGFSISASVDTLAVGVYLEDSNQRGVGGDPSNNLFEDSGAVFVFRREGSVWNLEAYIKASNADEGDQFGWSVSLEGDTLAVGAPFEESVIIGIDGPQDDNSTTRRGAVYVFQRMGSDWFQTAYIKSTRVRHNELFGYSVALSGALLAVGAQGDSGSGSGVNAPEGAAEKVGSGAVHVYKTNGIKWGHEAYIKSSNSDAGDQFGTSVALHGNTLVVGAPGEDSSASGVDGNQLDNSEEVSGAAYVFVRNGENWEQEAYLKASNSETYDRFGDSVAIYGDTVVVGAPTEDSSSPGVVMSGETDNGASSSGAVYSFTRQGQTWSQHSYIKASNPHPQARFGTSVVLGQDLLFVGSPRESSGSRGVNENQISTTSPSSGAVYGFRFQGAWEQVLYNKAPNADSDDFFGRSVALTGNYLFVGAPGEDSVAAGSNGDQSDNSIPESGAAYVYQLGP